MRVHERWRWLLPAHASCDNTSVAVLELLWSGRWRLPPVHGVGPLLAGISGANRWRCWLEHWGPGRSWKVALTPVVVFGFLLFLTLLLVFPVFSAGFAGLQISTADQLRSPLTCCFCSLFTVQETLDRKHVQQEGMCVHTSSVQGPPQVCA